MRPQAIPLAISHRVIDCGICGLDCLMESEIKELEIITELKYGKVSKEAVKIVIFGMREDLVDDKNIAVYSEYPNIARTFFKKSRIDSSHGSTEIMVLEGIYDYAVSVTETGKTLRRNGLKILKILLESPVILLAREKTFELEIFGKMLAGVFEAGKKRILTMNASKKVKEAIIKILPSLESPTISSLINGNFAISAVVEKDGMAELMVQLCQLGATGIYSQEANFIL